jgi:hypothetical protein
VESRLGEGASVRGAATLISLSGNIGDLVRTIRVGVLTEDDPFSHTNLDGRVEGFAVDLLAGIERVMSPGSSASLVRPG